MEQFDKELFERMKNLSKNVRPPNHKDILVVLLCVFLGFLIWCGVTCQRNLEAERFHREMGFYKYGTL